ncbi:MAG: hypothetical protein U0X20_09335 [Caldilineaceae bacterium]
MAYSTSFIGRLRQPQRQSANADAPFAQRAQRLPPAPLLADQVRQQDAHVLKGHGMRRRAVQPHLFLRLADGDPRGVCRHQDLAQAAAAASGSVRQSTMIVSAILALVAHIFAPLMTQLSPSRRAAVRTPPCRSDPAPGSSQNQAAEAPLAGSQPRRPGLLQLGCTIVDQWALAQTRLWADTASAVEPHAHPQFLHGNRGAHSVQYCAAIFLGHLQ